MTAAERAKVSGLRRRSSYQKSGPTDVLLMVVGTYGLGVSIREPWSVLVACALTIVVLLGLWMEHRAALAVLRDLLGETSETGGPRT